MDNTKFHMERFPPSEKNLWLVTATQKSKSIKRNKEGGIEEKDWCWEGQFYDQTDQDSQIQAHFLMYHCKRKAAEYVSATWCEFHSGGKAAY